MIYSITLETFFCALRFCTSWLILDSRRAFFYKSGKTCSELITHSKQSKECETLSTPNRCLITKVEEMVGWQANITKKLVEEEVVIKMTNHHLWLLQNFSAGSGVKKNKTQLQHQWTALKTCAVVDTPVVFSSR